MGGVGKRRERYLSYTKENQGNLVGKWVCLWRERWQKRHEKPRKRKERERGDFWLVLFNQMFLSASLPPSYLISSLLSYGMLYKVVCSFGERNTHFWLLGSTFAGKLRTQNSTPFVDSCVSDLISSHVASFNSLLSEWKRLDSSHPQLQSSFVISLSRNHHHTKLRLWQRVDRLPKNSLHHHQTR